METGRTAEKSDSIGYVGLHGLGTAIANEESSMKTINQILTISSILATAALLTLCFASCNTTRGFGADMQHLGGEIQQEAAERTRY